MKTIFKHTILSLVLLTGAYTAQAQVKIGSSPTVIGANSNLEVQATNGKKVIVHKDDGTVVIENTPLGSITNDILTVDAAGNVRKVSTTSLAPPVYIFEALGSQAAVAEGGSIYLPFESDMLMNPGTAAADRNGPSTWKAPAAGLYRIDIDVFTVANNNAAGNGITTVNLEKGGVGVPASASATLASFGPGYNQTTATVFFSKVLSLAAGESIRAGMSPCLGCGPNYYWGRCHITIQRLE